jgi:predicted NBD/HSP70 family sugar kinase
MTSFGFDIGGSSIKAVRLDGAGPRRTTHAVHEREPTPESLSRTLARLFAELEGPSVPDARRVAGVCLPGLVGDDGTLRYAANLPGLVGSRPAALLRDAIGLAAEPSLLTDSAAAGLGAWHARPTEGRLLTLAMGTGVGAALIDAGRLVTLDGRTPGHVGQIDVSLGEPDPPVGPDGGRGSLEAYVGWPALVARFGETGAPGAIAALTPQDPALRALARALRVCHAIHKPDEIRLLGGVGALFEPVLPLLHDVTSEGLTAVARPGWTLTTMDDLHLAATGVARYAADASGLA